MNPLYNPKEIGCVFEIPERKKSRKEHSKTEFRKRNSENFVWRIRDNDDV